MLEILKALKVLLSDQKYLILFVSISFFIFILMFAIPVYSIPGNTAEMQSVLFQEKDYFMLIVLSLLSSLVLTIQIAVISQKNKLGAGASTLNGLGIFSGIFSSLFASATCGLCIGVLFSFLGAGTILILVENRWYIMLGAIGLLFLSLYLSSRRYNKGCELCLIN